MIIKEFKEFIKKYQKINEGGGAGKDFIFENISGQLYLEISSQGIDVYKKEVTLGGPLKIEGYMEGISDLDPEKLFDIDLKYNTDLEKIYDITLDKIHYFTGLKEFENSKKTIREYITEGEKIDLNVNFDSEYSYMFGAGFLISTMSKGDKIEFDIFNGNTDEFIFVSLNNINGGSDLFADILNVKIVLTAKESMEELYDKFFLNAPSYDEYLDNFDEEQEDYKMSEEEFYQMLKDDLLLEYGYEK